MIAALTVFTLHAGGVALAQTDPVAEFYRGKTVNVLVPFAPGGGYDIYARLVAQFLGRHIPGQPTVIVQNMPGAGGLRAARYLTSAAPKDGTVLSIPSQTLPFDTVLGYTSDIDAGVFNWLGRIAMNVEVGAAFSKSGIASIDDLRTREISVGGTGGTGSSTVVPFLLNKLAGTKFKLVAGYKSANEVMLAMERSEVDMVGATGISTIMAKHAAQLKDGTIRLIYQSALKRHPLIPNVPRIGELGGSADDKQILNLFASGSSVGRALIASPGVPVTRVSALQQAVAATLSDPAFIASAKKGNIALEPGSADELMAIVRGALSTPKAVAARAREVMESLKAK